MTPLAVDLEKTALLLMDFQTMIVDNYSWDAPALLVRTANLLRVARQVGVMVVHVIVQFRAGYPEISPRNRVFAPIKGANLFGPDDRNADIHAALVPATDEAVVVKRRVSAFAGTDLDMILRSRGIDTLVLTGVATSGVVLSTARQAFDADYQLIVAGDCCSDRDQELHQVLLDKVFVQHATVSTGEHIASSLAG